ncbi:hypothetical protein GCM10009539_06210 [Cryptosporangium japonicum]|uniref:Uncharacterized protein n=1 Tax=Cryptosporangium japonicum TaxID=80872 RepID=A0ABN0TK70_9ACTN
MAPAIAGALGTGVHDPAAVADAVTRCHAHPLAVRIAAARVRHRPAWQIDDLNRVLRDRPRGLGALSTRDLDLNAAFAASYRRLTPAQQRAFSLLCLHPAGEFDLDTAAAISGLPPADAEETVEALADANLLEVPGFGRYRYYGLLRDFALASCSEELRAQRPDARRRLLEHYLVSFHDAGRTLYPEAGTTARSGSFADAPAARKWYETERECAARADVWADLFPPVLDAAGLLRATNTVAGWLGGAHGRAPGAAAA